MSEVKLCRDCRWVQRTGVWPFRRLAVSPDCLAPKLQSRPSQPDPVDGSVYIAPRPFARQMRLLDAPCGPAGKLWEPRP